MATESLKLDSKLWKKLKVSDLVVLLYHVHKGAEHPNVGFEDANRTIDELLKTLDKSVWIDGSALESALWSCNLMDEEGEFWHPKDRTFDEFVRAILPNVKFDKFYNYIKDEE